MTTPARIVQIAASLTEVDTLYALDIAGGLWALEEATSAEEPGAWLRIAPPTAAARIVGITVASGDEDVADILYALDEAGAVYHLAEPMEPEGPWQKLEVAE